MTSQSREKPLIISQRNFERVAAERGWTGTGTDEDPIIIEGTFPEMHLKVNHFSSGVIIRELKNKILTLYKCDNVIIENSSLSLLSASYCHKLHVRDCLIVKTKFMYSRNNTFSNTTMTRESLSEITAHYSERQSLIIMKFAFPFIILGLSVALSSPAMWQFMSPEITLMVLIFIPMIVGLIGLGIFSVWRSIRKARKLPPNKTVKPVIKSKQEIIQAFFE